MIPKFAARDSLLFRASCAISIFRQRFLPLPSPSPFAISLGRAAFCGGHKGSNAAGACTE